VVRARQAGGSLLAATGGCRGAIGRRRADGSAAAATLAACRAGATIPDDDTTGRPGGLDAFTSPRRLLRPLPRSRATREQRIGVG